MSVRCLGSRAQSLLSHLFVRQLGLRASRSFAGPQPPQALSCVQILERQLGAGPQHSRRGSQPALRAQQRRTLARAEPASSTHAAASMTQQAGAEAVAATPASDARNGVPTAAQPATEARAADGCTAYETQLADKVAHVRALFTDFQLPELEIFRSAPDHSRLRYVRHASHWGRISCQQTDRVAPEAHYKVRISRDL
jgi:tRNA (Uracil-5-)-methyltransferase